DLFSQQRPVLLACGPALLIDDDVDTEWAFGQLPGAPDEAAHLNGLHAAHAEHTEATGVRNGGNEFRTGRRPDPGRQDRVLDTEISTERRPERGHVRHRDALAEKSQL